jgi:hypothetical protein
VIVRLDLLVPCTSSVHRTRSGATWRIDEQEAAL